MNCNKSTSVASLDQQVAEKDSNFIVNGDQFSIS